MGFCTTIKHGNAWPIVHLLLRHVGFEPLEPRCHQVRYRFADEAGSVWLFTQESLEKDADQDACRYGNTGHAPDLPRMAALVETARDICGLGIAAPGRAVLVLGNARKGKLCHESCLLVRDFDGAAACRGERRGLERALQFLAQALEAPQLQGALKEANRHFVLVRALERCADKRLEGRGPDPAELARSVVGYLLPDPRSAGAAASAPLLPV